MKDERICLVITFKNKEALMEWLRVWKAFKEIDTKVSKGEFPPKSMDI